MREILFRAKTTVKEDKNHVFNNVWVEGDLIVSNGRYYIHPRTNKVNVENELGKLIVMHEVQKDTICEYDKKIYNKAIDDFTDKISKYGTYDDYGNVIDVLEIAEELKRSVQ